MNDNPISIESDMKCNVSSSLKWGMESESNPAPSNNKDFKPEVVRLNYDSKMEGASESLLDEAHSKDSSETFFPTKSDRGENFIEMTMPHLVLTKVEIEVSCQRIERAIIFVKK